MKRLLLPTTAPGRATGRLVSVTTPTSTHQQSVATNPSDRRRRQDLVSYHVSRRSSTVAPLWNGLPRSRRSMVGMMKMRTHSTTSAAALFEEDEEERQYFDTAEEADDADRPRLQQLRRRLQQEEKGTRTVVRLTEEEAAPRRQQHEKAKQPDRPLSILEKQQPVSREEWEMLLDQLDDPPAATSSSSSTAFNHGVSPVLTDRYHRPHSYLRLSLTERCNLRCTYCMPPDGVPLQPASDHLLSTSELLQLATHFGKLGVRKFRLTGGEPTLRKDLLDIVRGLQALEPQQIGMTTNGILLGSGKTDKLMHDLVDAGLNSINISLDTLRPDEFERLTRRPQSNLARVMTALERALSAAAQTTNLTVKVNCVVMRGVNDGGQDIADFIQLPDQFPGGSLQIRFIEYMPFTENGWDTTSYVPYKELLALPEVQALHLRSTPSDDPHDTTKWYSRAAAAGGNTKMIGFITSMSSHFCAGCNRLRIGADGQFKVCLFDGRTVLNLRDALRAGLSSQQLDKLLYHAVQTKFASLGGHANPASLAQDVDMNRPMTLIGG